MKTCRYCGSALLLRDEEDARVRCLLCSREQPESAPPEVPLATLRPVRPIRLAGGNR